MLADTTELRAELFFLKNRAKEKRDRVTVERANAQLERTAKVLDLMGLIRELYDDLLV